MGKYTVFKFVVTHGKYQVWTNNQCPVVGGVGGGALNGGYALANDGTAQYLSISRILDTSKGETSPSGASECTFCSDNKSECESFDIVNIGLHFILKNVRPYAASCSEA